MIKRGMKPKMTTYILRRLLLILPTFLGITVMVFVITRFVPGGPIERMIAQAQQMQSMDGKSGARPSSRDQNQPLSEEQIEALKK